jgi:hypothetical protein
VTEVFGSSVRGANGIVATAAPTHEGTSQPTMARRGSWDEPADDGAPRFVTELVELVRFGGARPDGESAQEKAVTKQAHPAHDRPERAAEQHAHAERRRAFDRDATREQEQPRREQRDERRAEQRERRVPAEHAPNQVRCRGIHDTPSSGGGGREARGRERSRRESAGRSIGSTMRNVEPRPSSLSSSTRPPCICTRRRVMASPSPVPARRRRASLDCQYSSKMAS